MATQIESEEEVENAPPLWQRFPTPECTSAKTLCNFMLKHLSTRIKIISLKRTADVDVNRSINQQAHPADYADVENNKLQYGLTKSSYSEERLQMEYGME